jgi:hypothetical protein
MKTNTLTVASSRPERTQAWLVALAAVASAIGINLASAAPAQAAVGSVYGCARDKAGNSLAGAFVFTQLKTETGYVYRDGKANAGACYSFPGLPPNHTYQVWIFGPCSNGVRWTGQFLWGGQSGQDFLPTPLQSGQDYQQNVWYQGRGNC